jgi:exopolyphosphatase/guanosine-5'-triphosphate,3'-diphosphate pyrophosphatase
VANVGPMLAIRAAVGFRVASASYPWRREAQATYAVRMPEYSALPTDCSVPEASPQAGVSAFAAVDLGTNNCRLLVGAPCADGFRVLDSLSRIVRLGEGLQEHGALGTAAMDRAMQALHQCADRLARRRVAATRGIATEACRRASNGKMFLDRVRRETGLALDVISAREEAELAIESCAPLFRTPAASDLRRALLLDIGGGSTELAWVRLPGNPDGRGHDASPHLIGTVSLPLGVIDVAEAWRAGPLDEARFEATVDAVARRLRGFEQVHRISQEIRYGGVALLGTSGTVTTLAGIALGLPRYRRLLVDGVVLSADAALQAVARLRDMGPEGLAANPCVGPDRAEFVLPGCAIFAAIHRTWPAEQVMVADRGLREGMLLRMMREDARRVAAARKARERAATAA